MLDFGDYSLVVIRADDQTGPEKVEGDPHDSLRVRFAQPLFCKYGGARRPDALRLTLLSYLDRAVLNRQTGGLVNEFDLYRNEIAEVAADRLASLFYPSDLSERGAAERRHNHQHH